MSEIRSFNRKIIPSTLQNLQKMDEKERIIISFCVVSFLSCPAMEPCISCASINASKTQRTEAMLERTMVHIFTISGKRLVLLLSLLLPKLVLQTIKSWGELSFWQVCNIKFKHSLFVCYLLFLDLLKTNVNIISWLYISGSISLSSQHCAIYFSTSRFILISYGASWDLFYNLCDVNNARMTYGSKIDFDDLLQLVYVTQTSANQAAQCI